MIIPDENRLLSKDHLTIGDIALKADVSKTTVSRVINNSNLVNKQTKRKVLKVIEELNFTPNAMARSLVKKTSKTIGFMIPDVLNPFYMELIQSIEEVISKYGFSMYLCVTNQDPEKEEYYINEMLERRTNGLLAMCTSISATEVLRKALQNIEMVSIQADIEGIDKVDTTGEQGTFEIIEHLIKLGHTKIAFIGYRFDIKTLNNRLMGYKKALEKYNIPLRDEYILEGSVLGNSGYYMAKKLLDLNDRPTAVHCFNEYLVMGAYLAIKEQGLKIPQDISLTGFDNLFVSRLMSPQLTTVSQPISAMGQIAGELLIKNILEGSKPVKQSIVLPTNLVIRGSTAPPKK